MMTLARRCPQGAMSFRDIASVGDLPKKFLELVLLELKNAWIVESVSGAAGGYRLCSVPSEIQLSEIIRLVDGALAPFGDADQLKCLIARDAIHRALYRVFWDVRDVAGRILENTTVADIVSDPVLQDQAPTKDRALRSSKNNVFPAATRADPARMSKVEPKRQSG